MLSQLAANFFNPGLETLQAKLAEATATRDRLRVEYRDACLTAEEDESGAAAKHRQALGEALGKAEARIAELGAAVEASHVRADRAAEEADRAAYSARWDEAAARAPQRLALARKLEKQLAAAFSTLDELVDESLEFHRAAPRRDNELAHSAASRTSMENALRIHVMREHGQRWAWPWLGDVRTAPTLSDSVAKGNELIMGLRDDGR